MLLSYRPDFHLNLLTMTATISKTSTVMMAMLINLFVAILEGKKEGTNVSKSLSFPVFVGLMVMVTVHQHLNTLGNQVFLWLYRIKP